MGMPAQHTDSYNRQNKMHENYYILQIQSVGEKIKLCT